MLTNSLRQATSRGLLDNRERDARGSVVTWE
jgi:hypothetical protein